MNFPIVSFLLLNAFWSCAFCGRVTENSIGRNIVNSEFASIVQNHFGINKPSKLRLYLLADLAKASSEEKILLDCKQTLDLRVTTKNCNCIHYSCHRFHKLVKTPRILERSCDDFCCGKHRFKGKSLETSSEQASKEAKCVEFKPSEENKFQFPWVISLTSKRYNNCLGTLITRNTVMTFSNCVEPSDEKIQVTLHWPETRSQVADIQNIHNNSDETVTLVLKESLISTETNGAPCLPRNDLVESYTKCYLPLWDDHAIPVAVLDEALCHKSINDTKLPQQPVCIDATNIQSENVPHGTPLICSSNVHAANSFQIIGIFVRRHNNSLIFDNVNRIKSTVL